MESGESVRAAAVREIAEETGIIIEERQLAHLAYAEGDGQVGEITGPMRDDFFLTEVPDVSISTAGMEDQEAAAFGEYRWWHPDDLVTTAELVFPRQLGVALLDSVGTIDRDGPRRLPW